MSSDVFWLIYVIYFAMVSITSSKSGPFIATPVRIENCNRTDAISRVMVEIYNTSKRENLIKGNFSVLEPDPGLTLSIHDYFLVDGQWHLTYGINRLSCRSYLVSTMGKLFGITFNKKTCAVPKGTYTFQNVNFDFVDHVFAMTKEYGTVLRVVEVSSKKKVLVCIEFEFVVTPKKK